MAKKIDAGADYFQTQVVYDVEKTIGFLKEAKKFGKPVLLTIWPGSRAI